MRVEHGDAARDRLRDAPAREERRERAEDRLFDAHPEAEIDEAPLGRRREDEQLAADAVRLEIELDARIAEPVDVHLELHVDVGAEPGERDKSALYPVSRVEARAEGAYL